MGGIFFLGTLFPFVNKWGVHVGYIVGAGISVWNYVGSLRYPPGSEQTRVLPQWTQNCNQSQVQTSFFNTSVLDDFVVPRQAEESPAISEFYSISYMYLGTLAMVCCMITGIIVSLATGGQPNLNRRTVRNIWKYFPDGAQRVLSC